MVQSVDGGTERGVKLVLKKKKTVMRASKEDPTAGKRTGGQSVELMDGWMAAVVHLDARVKLPRPTRSPASEQIEWRTALLTNWS